MKIVKQPYPPKNTNVFWLDNTDTLRAFHKGKWQNVLGSEDGGGDEPEKPFIPTPDNGYIMLTPLGYTIDKDDTVSSIYINNNDVPEHPQIYDDCGLTIYKRPITTFCIEGANTGGNYFTTEEVCWFRAEQFDGLLDSSYGKEYAWTYNGIEILYLTESVATDIASGGTVNGILCILNPDWTVSVIDNDVEFPVLRRYYSEEKPILYYSFTPTGIYKPIIGSLISTDVPIYISSCVGNRRYVNIDSNGAFNISGNLSALSFRSSCGGSQVVSAKNLVIDCDSDYLFSGSFITEAPDILPEGSRECMFHSCTFLTTPPSIIYIGQNSSYYSTFESCDNITTANIIYTIKDDGDIPELNRCFYYCLKLSELYINIQNSTEYTYIIGSSNWLSRTEGGILHTNCKDFFSPDNFSSLPPNWKIEDSIQIEFVPTLCDIDCPFIGLYSTDSEEVITLTPYEDCTYKQWVVNGVIENYGSSVNISTIIRTAGYADRIVVYVECEAPTTGYLKVTGLQYLGYTSQHPSLSYSIDNGEHWYSVPRDNLVDSIPKDAVVLLRGNNPNGFHTDAYQGTFRFNSYSYNGVTISGRLMALVDNGTGTINEIPNDWCFRALFYGSLPNIYDASKLYLPNSVTAKCFYQMFMNSNLHKPPQIVCKYTDEECYKEMFNGCRIDSEYPYRIPALHASKSAFESMFNSNFSSYSSLYIDTITAEKDAFASAFRSTGISKIDIKLTGYTTQYLYNWLQNVSEGVVYCEPDAEYISGASGIPSNWIRKDTYPLIG